MRCTDRLSLFSAPATPYLIQNEETKIKKRAATFLGGIFPPQNGVASLVLFFLYPFLLFFHFAQTFLALVGITFRTKIPRLLPSFQCSTMRASGTLYSIAIFPNSTVDTSGAFDV